MVKILIDDFRAQGKGSLSSKDSLLMFCYKMFKYCIVMCYVLRVVSRMYSKVVESKMTKRLWV